MLEQAAVTLAPRAMETSAAELRELIGLSARLARGGRGEAAIRLALVRRGVGRDPAQLIAASVVSCRAVLLAAGSAAQSPHPEPQVSRENARDADLRAARAATLALSKMLSFLIFVVVGAGGGALLGWGAGFEAGLDDGARWVVSAMLQLASQ